MNACNARLHRRWRRPCGRLHTIELLLDPPVLDVVDGAERCRVEVLKALLRDRKNGVRVAEVVRLILVQDLVEGLVVRLSRGRRAVPVGRVASLLDRLVHRGVLEEGEAEAGRTLRRVRDLAGVPDLVRVRVATEAPT